MKAAIAAVLCMLLIALTANAAPSIHFHFHWQNRAQLQDGENMPGLAEIEAEMERALISSYNKQEALLNAEMSSLAYRSYSDVGERLRNYHLEAKMKIFDRETDTNGFIAANDSIVVVAFRGTSSVADVLIDLYASRIRITNGRRETAHAGFVTSVSRVYNGIAETLRSHTGKRLYITGHSLGGALASLLTFRLRYEANIRPAAQFVYGCPPVGDRSFARSFDDMSSHTITIRNDPVSAGGILQIGAWLGLYKPDVVEYLPRLGGHYIADYIEQIREL